jgi:hypothetical protein
VETERSLLQTHQYVMMETTLQAMAVVIIALWNMATHAVAAHQQVKILV